MALFPIGKLVTTPAAARFCDKHQISMVALLARHIGGDYGDVSNHDKAANKEALTDGSRIFSAYRFKEGRIWIITEAVGDDGLRASTCIMTPEDY